MDTQKLGRALGYGTRHAAKTIAAVAEAAAAPDPRRPAAAQAPPQPTPVIARPAQARPPLSRGPSPAVSTKTHTGNNRAAKSSGSKSQGFWAPLATFSSALWLRVTGLFFGLLALSLGTGAWRLRRFTHAGSNPEQMHHFWIFLAFALLFSYFAASSFVRATLRERRPARL